MKISAEKEVIEKMIRLYCRLHKHPQNGILCDECDKLLNYAHTRLDKCPFEDNKNACKQCAIHCYKPAMREQMRVVMRYRGPRMIFYSPRLAIKHLTNK